MEIDTAVDTVRIHTQSSVVYRTHTPHPTLVYSLPYTVQYIVLVRVPYKERWQEREREEKVRVVVNKGQEIG